LTVCQCCLSTIWNWKWLWQWKLSCRY